MFSKMLRRTSWRQKSCIYSIAIIWNCILEILTQSVLLVHLKNNLKHYSWTQNVIFLHDVCSIINQDKMLYFIIILIMVIN